MDLTPWRLSPVQGGYPQNRSILPFPQEGFTPCPLIPRFKCFPATTIFAHLLSSVVFFCLVYCIELYWLQKLLLIEEFIKLELIKNILTCLFIDVAKVHDCPELCNFEILIDIDQCN